MLEKIFSVIDQVFMSQPPEIKLFEKKYPLFPFESAYQGQNESIEALINLDRSVLCSHTGSGKTAVYLTAALTTRYRTLILAPRNFLQDQIEEYNKYFSDEVIFSLKGKLKHCRFGAIDYSLRAAPCEARYFDDSRKNYFFTHNGVEYIYPCPDCEYEKQKTKAISFYNDGRGVLVLNQGNFWMLSSEMAYPEFVIIDEADEFVRAITQGFFIKIDEMKMIEDAAYKKEDFEFVKLFKKADAFVEEANEGSSRGAALISKLLQYYVAALLEKSETLSQHIKSLEEKLSLAGGNDEELKKELVMCRNAKNACENKLHKVRFYLKNVDRVFLYKRKEHVGIYVEMFTTEEETVLRLFRHAKKLCISTATPFEVREFKQVSYEIPFRAKVIYAPVGKLTYWEVYRKGNTDLLRKAVEDYIIPIHDYVSALLGSKTKTPIHCGSLSRHGTFIADILKNNGKQVLLHKEGHLDETIKMFREKDYDFLCVVAAEYGADWYWCPLQFVVKVPYADASDPREQAIRKRFSEEEWKRRYDWDALSRLVQACGRNARKPEQFSVTVILDQKFEEVYTRYYHLVPQWFKNRLIWLSSTPPPEPGA